MWWWGVGQRECAIVLWLGLNFQSLCLWTVNFTRVSPLSSLRRERLGRLAWSWVFPFSHMVGWRWLELGAKVGCCPSLGQVGSVNTPAGYICLICFPWGQTLLRRNVYFGVIQNVSSFPPSAWSPGIPTVF